MLPQKIILENFGPYIHETIDFSEFDDTGLFLISGKTGSGKTTIFDAMTYALFGESSGKIRDAKEMRSNFASPTEKTEVTFTFSHQNHLYTITRSPEQHLAKKRGTGEVKHNAKVNLVVADASGKEQENYTKASAVSEFITELLHLNAKQFKQIVLLPQGEFRNFLVANSKEKETLLRNLFGTELYQQLNNWLAEKLKNENNEYAKKAEAIQQFLNQITELESVAIPDKIQEAHDYLAIGLKEVTELKMQFEAQKKQTEAAKAALATLESLEKAFAELANVEKRQAEHVLQASAYAEQKAELSQRQAAEKMRPLIEQKESTDKQIQVVTEKLTTIQESQSQNTRDLEAWQSQIQVSKERVAALEVSTADLVKLKELLPLVGEYDRLTKAVAQADHVVATKEASLKENEGAVAAFTSQLATHKLLAKQIVAFEQKQTRLQQLTLSLTHLEKETQRMQQHEKKVVQQAAQVAKFQAELPRMQAKLATARAAHEHVQSVWAKNQIARLSQLLLPNEACPVCGSLDHPHPAVADDAAGQDMIALEQALADHEKAKGQAQVQLTSLETKLATQAMLLEEERAEQAQLVATNGDLTQATVAEFVEKLALVSEPAADELRHLLKTSQAETVQALKQAQVAGEKVTQLEHQIEQASANVSNWQTQLVQAKMDQHAQQAELVQLQQRLPEARKQTLATDIHTLAEAIKEAQAQEEAYQLAGQQLKTTGVRLAEQLAQVKQQLAELARRYQEQALALQEALSALGLPLEQVKAYLETPQKMLQLEAFIHTYEDESLLLQNDVARLTKATANQVRPDLREHQALVRELTLQQKDLEVRYYEVASKQKQKSELLKTAETKYAQSAVKLKQLAQLQQLSDAVNGNNVQKTSLERYILKSYMQDVLEEANVRLRRLTQGRYSFVLDESTGSYKGSTGLEINVFDEYNDSQRSAHTLSGGESFIASLALALALADVIQKEAGGVAIEALFIDEGFGSLDEESLQMAMEALETIENEGRMIGIISHVNELKQRIGQQLQIVTHNGQSKVNYFIGGVAR
jgi:exonuclease SbcC